jgi:hypothetical protein
MFPAIPLDHSAAAQAALTLLALVAAGLNYLLSARG